MRLAVLHHTAREKAPHGGSLPHSPSFHDCHQAYPPKSWAYAPKVRGCTALPGKGQWAGHESWSMTSCRRKARYTSCRSGYSAKAPHTCQLQFPVHSKTKRNGKNGQVEYVQHTARVSQSMCTVGNYIRDKQAA